MNSTIYDELLAIFPQYCIFTTQKEKAPFLVDTTTLTQNVQYVVEAENVSSIQRLLLLANRLNFSIYPVSSGKNWGYGSGLPPQPVCILLHLGKLKQISFDSKLGLLTLEPGVTQGDLHKFFAENDYDYMVPTTGAGPGCSIIGNALERGYGITPATDHFGAVMGLEALLPNGELYRSPLLEGNFKPLLKWGVGSYLDGIFSQSNLGIVTSMTILVEKKTDIVEMFITRINAANLENAINKIAPLIASCRGNIGGINLMNQERLHIMKNDANHYEGAIKSRSWMLIGTIYGTKHHTKATRKVIKNHLSGSTGRVLFITSLAASRLRKLSKLIPAHFSSIKKDMYDLVDILGLFEGKPSEISLRLAYYKNREAEGESSLDPARDECGLLWYAPLVPMDGESILKFINFVAVTCQKFGIEPALTLTSLSHIAFDSTLPLQFSFADPIEEKKCFDCYEELVSKGRDLGFTPYRLNAHFMKQHVLKDQRFYNVFRTIKQSLDPKNIISPGRYE
jgi:4-cresol dehydrogenase (hydroxylating)